MSIEAKKENKAVDKHSDKNKKNMISEYFPSPT